MVSDIESLRVRVEFRTDCARSKREGAVKEIAGGLLRAASYHWQDTGIRSPAEIRWQSTIFSLSSHFTGFDEICKFDVTNSLVRLQMEYMTKITKSAI